MVCHYLGNRGDGCDGGDRSEGGMGVDGVDRDGGDDGGAQRRRRKNSC